MAFSNQSAGDSHPSLSLAEDTNQTTGKQQALHLGSDVISSETRQLIEAVCLGGVTSLICLISIPANVLNCVVFWRQGLQERMNVCLFCLALGDCCHMTCTFAVYSVNAFIRFADPILSEEYSTNVFVYLTGVLHGLRTTSHCISTAIAVERCVCVVYPLHAASFLHTRTMGALVFFCFLLSQGCYLLLPLSYHVVKVTADGQTGWKFFPTSFFESNRIVVYTLLYTVLGTMVPLVALVTVCVTTVVTVVKLREALSWREKSSSRASDGHSQQVALTKMLVVVSCVYIVTVAPFVMWQTSFWFVGKCLSTGTCYDIFMAFSAVVFMISYVNSCVHIVIYYSRSTRFRLVLRSLLCDAARLTSGGETSASAVIPCYAGRKQT